MFHTCYFRREINIYPVAYSCIGVGIEQQILRGGKISHTREADQETVLASVVIVQIYESTTQLWSFSTHKKIKDYNRTTIMEEELNNLIVLHIESEIMRLLNYDDAINAFAKYWTWLQVILVENSHCGTQVFKSY